MPFVLDTDHLSVLLWQEQPACDRLRARLQQLPPDDLATTIVSFQEQVQGWLAYLNRARKPEHIVRAYAELEVVGRTFLRIPVLPFSSAAQERFAALRHECPRLQTMDLRIASIALVTQATLLSRNLRHFRRVPGLTVQDWTV